MTDYLVGCHAPARPVVAGDADNDLCVFVGSNECVICLTLCTRARAHLANRGDISLVTRPTFSADTPWLLQHTWKTAHVGIVRAALWDERVSAVYMQLLMCMSY